MSQNNHSKDSRAHFNPIDVVEDVASTNDWAYQRTELHEMHIDFEGRWSDYRLQFFWYDELHMLHIASIIELPIDHDVKKEICELVASLNYRLLVGHFEMTDDQQMVAYRMGQYYENAKCVKASLLEDLIGFALTEIERFFPAFQFVALGDKTAQEAMSVVMLDTVGEA